MTRSLLLFCVLFAFGAGRAAAENLRHVEFDVAEGTWISLDISPAGSQLVFDLLGDIYTLPAQGGKARPIATGPAWQHQPRFSPDDEKIAYISDADGQLNLWVMSSDGGSPRQISNARLHRLSSPAWCGNHHLVVRRLGGSREELLLYHVDGGAGLPLRATASYANISGPVCSPDGRHLFFSAPLAGEYSFYHGKFVASQQILRLNFATGEVVPLTAGMAGGLRPAISRDGKLLAFAKRQSGVKSLWVRNLDTGKEQRVVPRLFGNGLEAPTHADLLPGYAFSPDGRSIYLQLDGRISRVAIASKASTEIPFQATVKQELAPLLKFPREIDDDVVQARIVRWPTLSNDRKRLYFSSLAKLWSIDLPRGKPRRLTDSDLAEYAPALSPDGRSIVYSTWSDAVAGGHLVLANADGSQQKPLTKTTGQYLNPTWSADGSMVAYVRGSGGIEQLQQEPAVEYRAEIRWVDIASGNDGTIAIVGRPRDSERGHPVPTFSADNTRVYYIAEHDEPGRRALMSRRLDGTQEKTHLRFPAVDEGAVSPDEAQVALVRGNQIYVLPFFPNWAEPIDIDLDHYRQAPLPITRIASDRADFIGWQDANTLLWSAGPKVYQANVPSAPASDTTSTGRTSPAPQLVHRVNLTLPKPRHDGDFAITNARLITMQGDEVIANGTIVVHGNRIAAIGPSDRTPVPIDAMRIDGSGLTVMPGLIDAHGHMHMTDYGTYPQQIWQLTASLAFGVTTVLDPASRSVEIFELRDLIDVAWMMGPRLFSSGTILGGWNPVNNPWHRDVSSPDDARDLIRGHVSQGVDMLKEYMHPRRDQRQWIIQAAREAEVPVTGEQGGDFPRLLTMLLDGYTAVEHSLPIAPVYDDVVQLFVRSGTFHTPTFSIPNGGHGLLNYFSSQIEHRNDAKLRYFLPYDRFADYLSWRAVPDEEWFFKAQAKAANAISDAGGLVSLGSHNQYHGTAVHWELWARAEAGADLHDLLRDATLRGAQKIGIDSDVGSLVVGKLADFLVLTGNPLEDIHNSAEIRYVVKDGVVWHTDSMTQMWPAYRPLSKPWWHSAEDWAALRPELPEPWEGVALEKPTIH